MKALFLCLLSFCLFHPGVMAQRTQKDNNTLFHQEFSSKRTSGGFNYTLSTVMESYTDLVNPISINNNEIWDDPEYMFPLGIPFVLNGNEVTVMQFAGLGFTAIGETADPDVFTALLPFEADLIDRGDISGISMSPISYIVEGNPGSRIQKVEFKNAGSFEEVAASGTTDMFVNFQVWLYEGSNIIEFHYGPHFIDDPVTFYAFETGPLVGVSDVDVVYQELIHPHFLTGPVTKPVLSILDNYITGTPPNGMVYRLTPIDPLSVVVTGTDATSFCAPNGSATADVTGGTPPYTFSWSNGETTPAIENLGAGTYSVTVTDADTTSVTGSITLTQPDDLLANATSTDETVPDANDGTASVAPEGGLPPYSVEWSTGSTEFTITGLAPGNYMVTVTDDAGCIDIDVVVINAAECLELEVESALTSPSCHGLCDGSIQVLAVNGGTGPFQYAWSAGETTSGIAVCAGNYSVTILDANNCVVTIEFIVTEPPALVVNATAMNESSYQGQNGSVNTAVTGGTPPYTYSWSNGSTESNIDSLAPGVYIVTVSDSQGCLDSREVLIQPYVCSGTISFNLFYPTCAGICDGVASTGINGVPGIGYTYAWSNGATTQSISNLCSGEYIVTITGNDNCVYIDSIQIFEPEPLVVVVDSIRHFHDTTAASIWITASGGSPPYSYLWTGPFGFLSTLEDISSLPPGFYSVVVTDNNGCTLSVDSVEVLDLNTRIGDPFASQVRVYPNPVSDQIQLEMSQDLPFEVRLYTADGRHLQQWKNENRLSLSQILPGPYLLRITSGTSHWTGWIMKQ